MQTDKTIKDWMEQIDAIIEESAFDVVDFVEIENKADNCIDMLISLKAEMQEAIDTDLIIGTSTALNPTDVLK